MAPFPVPLSLLAVLGGCAPQVSYQDVRVTRATLQDANTHSITVLGGYVGGDALLVFSGPRGVSGALPVALRGGRAGLAFEVTFDLNPGSDIPLDLQEAGGEVWLSDLLGRYRGPGWALSALVGGGGRSLENAAGVRIKDRHFGLGGGAFIGMEWLNIHIGGNEDDINEASFQWPPLNDTGDPQDSGDPLDTSTPSQDTGDRQALSQGCGSTASESAAPAQDSGSSSSSSGGCGGGAQDSSTAGGDDSGDDGDDEDEDEDSNDTGSGGGGGGGCADLCSSSAALYGLGLGVLIGLRRRRRDGEGQG